MSTRPRLDRMFSTTGKCLDVAIDHGMVNEPALLTGIHDMTETVRVAAQASPDVIQLTPGMLRQLDGLRGADRPAVAMRTDVSNVYGTTLPSSPFSHVIPGAVELAVAADAVCVVVNLMLLPGQPDLHRQCITNVASLKRECEILGMPLMVEPLVMAANDRGGYMVDGDLELITALVRQAGELGADVIKADPCNDPEEFHRVVEVASGIPVLVRGGGREDDRIILERTRAIMLQGASGIVYGRNIIQHASPAAMVRSLMRIVHEQISTDEAMDLLGDSPTATAVA